MKNLGINASLEEKRALVLSEDYEHVNDQSVDNMKRAITNSSFEDGDELTIEPGFATPRDITNSEDKFLAFSSQIKRNGKTIDGPAISSKQLVSRSYSLENLTSFKTAQLSYRFGRIPVEIEELEVNGKTKTLFKLSSPVKVKITVAPIAYVPDRDTYDQDTRTYGACEEKLNYGYVK